jgi:phosphoenolpyruvate-protein kinase (PTS system EI component)
MGRILKGIAASPGVAIGNVFLYEEVELTFNEGTVSDSEAEIKKTFRSS